MPRPRPLSSAEAKRALANRFAGSKERPGLADRLRQLNTKFGLRSKRVFLTWTLSGGAERGEGTERILARVEILPTPKVSDFSSITRNSFSAGILPVGSIRVSEVSLGFTFDELAGTKVPGRTEPLNEPVAFCYEVVEDGRGDAQPIRQRFRLLGTPNRNEGMVSWTLLLERVSEDLDRRGRSQLGTDEDQL